MVMSLLIDVACDIAHAKLFMNACIGTTKSMGTSTRLLTCTVQRRSGCTFFPTCHT